jgi:cobalt/nickel transport system permease protein
MHMSDALVSPAVGGAMWVAAAAVGSYAARQVERHGGEDERRLPLMGVLGAFVFAAQMVNFTIPGTGSSGHLAGGLLLAVLVGPHAAFVVMASVLAVQALFFADGGLLALGCNVVNMGLFTSYLVYPLVWQPLAGDGRSRRRVFLASIAAGVLALQLGALGVVLETMTSGVTTLPFRPFALLMQSIHLAIGVVEGLVTALIVLALREARPELAPARATGRRIVATLAAAAALTGGALCWFASTRPDGLEWATARAAGEGAPAPTSGAHALLASFQERIALLPEYDFRRPRGGASVEAIGPRWGSPRAGSSLAGLLGAALSVGFVIAIGAGARALRRRAAGEPAPPRAGR